MFCAVELEEKKRKNPESEGGSQVMVYDDGGRITSGRQDCGETHSNSM